MSKYYPQVKLNYKDASKVDLRREEAHPVLGQIYVVKAQKGKTGIPVWCPNKTFAEFEFGEEFLNRNNPEYYSRASEYLNQIFEFTGAWIVRAEGTGMKTASLVFEVTIDTDTKAYNLTSREITDVEATPEGVAAADIVNDGTEYTIPLMAFQAPYVGVFGNNLGVNLFGGFKKDTNNNWVQTGTNSPDELARLGVYQYNLGFVELNGTTSLPSKWLTKYNTDGFDFAMDSAVINPATDATFGIGAQLERYFGREYPAPIDAVVCEDNIGILMGILAGMAEVEGLTALKDALTTGADQFDVFNLKSYAYVGFEKYDDNGTQADKILYDLENPTNDPASPGLGMLFQDNTGGAFTQTGIAYLAGGSDGSLNNNNADLDSFAGFETSVLNFWSLETNPTIQDAPRYPFNHVVDVGYPLAIKQAMIDLLAVRSDIVLVLSPWQGLAEPMDEAESVVASGTLLSDIRSHRESEVYGTDAFSAAIIGPTGFLAGGEYRKRLSYTLWLMRQLSKYHRFTYIDRQIEGEEAWIDVFDHDRISWSPYTDLAKQGLWGANVNYAQFFERDGMHFAGVKSAYTYESSVFANFSVVQTVKYIAQLLPRIYAKYASKTDANEEVYPKVIADITRKAGHLLNNKYAFTVNMYQTEQEAESGFEHHIAFDLFTSKGQRIWHADIIGNEA